MGLSKRGKVRSRRLDDLLSCPDRNHVWFLELCSFAGDRKRGINLHRCLGDLCFRGLGDAGEKPGSRHKSISGE